MIFEYKMVKLEVEDSLIMMAPHNEEARADLDKAIVALLNQEGKLGWLLTAAGLNHIPSIPLYREKPKQSRKKTLSNK